jgi:hypothetical protein
MSDTRKLAPQTIRNTLAWRVAELFERRLLFFHTAEDPHPSRTAYLLRADPWPFFHIVHCRHSAPLSFSIFQVTPGPYEPLIQTLMGRPNIHDDPAYRDQQIEKSFRSLAFLLL